MKVDLAEHVVARLKIFLDRENTTRGHVDTVALFGNSVVLTKAIEHARHQMKRAEGMGEARVFGALIRVEPESELFNAPQPLKFSRIDQTHHQLAFVCISAKANYVVNRIAIDSFGQDFEFFRSLGFFQEVYHASGHERPSGQPKLGDYCLATSNTRGVLTKFWIKTIFLD